MSTTVTYKGSTLATVENQIKKLDTAGTWLEDDITITDSGSGGGSVEDKFITVTFNNRLETGNLSLVYVFGTDLVNSSSGYVEMTSTVAISANRSVTRLMPYGFGLAVRTGALTNANTQNFEVQMNNTVIDPRIEGKYSTAYYKYYNISKTNLDSSNNVIDFYSTSDPFKDTVITDTLSATSNTTYTAPSGTAYSTVNVNVPDSTLVVTLSWDDDYFGQDDGAWVPDKTYAQIAAAYSAEKEIVVISDTDYSTGNIQTGGGLDAEENIFGYYLVQYDDVTESQTWYGYQMDSTGDINDIGGDIYYSTIQATISSNGQLLNGIKAVGSDGTLYTGNIPSKTSSDLTASGATVTVPAGHYASQATKTISSGTEGTPTATKGTVSNHAVTVTPSVTNSAGYISGGTHTGTAVTVSASELVSGTYTVDSSGTKDVTNYASASVPSGTAGTPSATKGTVSNHSVSVTPSVTNTTGWITGSTKTGTAVTVTASELASGNKAITENGTNIDVVGYSTVSVAVSGGGGSSVQMERLDIYDSVTTSSISFSGLQGEPTSFCFWFDGDIVPSSTAYIQAIVYDGTSLHGQTITNTSNAQVTYDGSSFSKTYSNGTLTITSTGARFYTDDAPYLLDYSYGGSAACIDTKDVQVGSGATSITFTGLEDEPIGWSLIFKSNFSTSSGYQRVIWADYCDNQIIGACMDSESHTSNVYWTQSYSNGSLTITSSGTNAGGYFHQPGYYQLTYVYDATGNYQSKTVTPTTSQQVITADSQYDALKKVTVEAIPSTYVQPTATQGATTYRASTTQQTIASGTYLSGTQTIAAVSQTNLSAENIKSGTTISISNGQNNIWSVTGTYEGSGSSGIGTLLATHSIGSVSTSSTSAANLNSDVSVSGINNYDLLIVETSVNTKTNNRHAATIRLIWLTASSTIGTKNGATLPSNTMNIRLSSNGTATSNQSTTQYGIYPYSCTISNGNATIVMYRRYNNSATGTINGTYTTRVYGVNLYDLIGG